MIQNLKKIKLSLCALLMITSFFSCKKKTDEMVLSAISSNRELLAATTPSSNSQQIPLFGNATFKNKPSGASEVFTSSNGLANWTNANTVASISTSIPYQGTLNLKLKLKVAPAGNSSVIRVTVDGVSKDLSISGETFHDVDAGEFIFTSAKTINIDFQGVSKTGGYFADLQSITLSGTAMNGVGDTYAVPISGNSFITSTDVSGANITGSNGLKDWTNLNTIVSTYVYAKNSGNISVLLKGYVYNGTSTIKVTVNGVSKNVTMTGGASTTVSDNYVGDFNVPAAGYVKIDIKGVSKTNTWIGDLTHIVVGSDGVANGARFCNVPESYYWARRGPSSHMGYSSNYSNATYFYNEVTVPTAAQNPTGTFYMAIGFNGGYFGIQNNSATRRTVLFSVWSPYSSDNPNQIPVEDRVTLNRKGPNTVSNDFGGEGSGGQSHIQFNWQEGTTYKFLVKGAPDGNGSTDFTAWFYAPEVGTWSLVASWKRPKTNGYLQGFHSFLEGFDPATGHLTRKVEFKNQWVYNGQWNAMTTGTFSVDNNFVQNIRSDVKGGNSVSGYSLQMGGFFNDYTLNGVVYNKLFTSTTPNVNFNTLP